MAELPILPLYCDALIADTTHLSSAEFGAYMLILMAMWRSGGALKNDERALRRISRMTGKQWAQSRAAIMALLRVEGEQITQKRLNAEYAKAQEKRATRAAAGSMGGVAKRANLVLVRDQKGILVRPPQAPANPLENNDPPPSNATANGVANAYHPYPDKEYTEAKASDAVASDGLDENAKGILFGSGLKWLVKTVGVTEPRGRSLIGQWLKIAHDDANSVLAALRLAKAELPAEPKAFITGVLRARHAPKLGVAPPSARTSLSKPAARI